MLIGGQEHRIVRHCRRDYETVGRVAMQALQVAREYSDVSSERNLSHA